MASSNSMVLVAFVMTTTTGLCDPPQPTGDTGDTGAPARGDYYYVWVEDLEDSSPNNPYGTDGCDIDAIELIHNGTSNYADSVEYISFGAGETDYMDANQVLGVPSGSCETSVGNFISMGGTSGVGGHVIVSFTRASGDLQAIGNGDQIRVHECGDSYETYATYVGTNADINDPDWHLCGSAMSGPSICTVNGLP